MEIKTTIQIRDEQLKRESWATGAWDYDRTNWIMVTEELKEAISLYLHLKNHTEVKESKEYTSVPMCKICNKSAYQIKCEEFKDLSK